MIGRIFNGTYIYVDCMSVEIYHLVVLENLANKGVYFRLGLPPSSHMGLVKFHCH